MANHDIPGRVTFLEGNGDLPRIEISTPWSNAELYLHGAHITHFQRKGEAPLLFMSQCSRFAANAPIRGGIPVIFPWFGPREGQPQHGFARNRAWQLKEILKAPSDEIVLTLTLPDCPEAALWPNFTAAYVVTIGKNLSAELTLKNESDQELAVETCLHTYFNVGAISDVSVTGLKGVEYLDKTQNFSRKREQSDAITFNSETDRVYLNTQGATEIIDRNLKRRIVVEKSGSASTIVWNPWIAKSQQMPDFGNDEYLRMVCVESGNVDENKSIIPPGQAATLKISLGTTPL